LGGKFLGGNGVGALRGAGNGGEVIVGCEGAFEDAAEGYGDVAVGVAKWVSKSVSPLTKGVAIPDWLIMFVKGGLSLYPLP
jgi:hypothetical protein